LALATGDHPHDGDQQREDGDRERFLLLEDLPEVLARGAAEWDAAAK
jgi:hypothetical protein